MIILWTKLCSAFWSFFSSENIKMKRDWGVFIYIVIEKLCIFYIIFEKKIVVYFRKIVRVFYCLHYKRLFGTSGPALAHSLAVSWNFVRYKKLKSKICGYPKSNHQGSEIEISRMENVIKMPSKDDGTKKNICWQKLDCQIFLYLRSYLREGIKIF